MNRLQKKCFVASAGCHLLLAVILVVGPAFLTSNTTPQDLPVLDFVPVKTVDALISGGGNPKGQVPPPPAAAPQPPPPVAQPTPAPAPPEPTPKPAVKEDKTEPDSLEPAKEAKHKVQVSTKLVKRNSMTNDLAKQQAEADAREAAAAEAVARRNALTAIRSAANGIQGGTAGSTTIELKGPGGGGLPYANWAQAVKTIYDNAWILPSGVDSGTVETSVTIARSGEVVSARIVRGSGNGTVDDSVRATLNRVKYAAPLPDDAKEDQRTVTIYFDVKAKLLG